MVKDNSKRRKNRRGMVIDNQTRKPCDDCKLIPEFVTEIRNRIKELDAQHKKHLEEEVINRIFSDNMIRLDVSRLPIFVRYSIC